MGKENEATPNENDKDQKGPQERRDLLDETVWESFPGSDPGGSWAGRDIPPDERKKKKN